MLNDGIFANPFISGVDGLPFNVSSNWVFIFEFLKPGIDAASISADLILTLFRRGFLEILSTEPFINTRLLLPDILALVLSENDFDPLMVYNPVSESFILSFEIFIELLTSVLFPFNLSKFIIDT